MKRITILLAVFILGFYAFSHSEAKNSSKEAYDSAVNGLKSSDPAIRRKSLEELAHLRNPQSKEEIQKLMKDKVGFVRSAAVDALGLMRVQESANDIGKLLQSDSDPQVRQTAAIALGYLSSAETIPALIKGVDDSHEGTRFACVNTLGILRNPAASSALAKKLTESTDPRMQKACAYALSNIQDRSVAPDIMKALELAYSSKTVTLDPEVGAMMARTLGILGDARAVNVIKPLLRVSDKKSKLYAAQALDQLGDGSGADVARKYLHDSEDYAREIAITILAHHGDQEDGQDLLALSKTDANENLRSQANSAVGEIAKRMKAEIAKPTKSKKSSPQKKAP